MSFFTSKNPATGEVIWEGLISTKKEIDEAVKKASSAFQFWSSFTVEERIEYLNKYQKELENNRAVLAEIISKETGKPLWESIGEVGSMISKIPISIEAYKERSNEQTLETPLGRSITRHRPHGVVGVFSPFNFPGHLPNGHIVPALLAGNTVVLKPSEQTPLVAEMMLRYWTQSGLPQGVLNIVQGGGETGEILAMHSHLNGLFFTGSFRIGAKLLKENALVPNKILALEMGGNNPLLVIPTEASIAIAVYHTLQSAYLTSGQRCTCARRLIVIKNPIGERFVEALMAGIEKIMIGPYTNQPEPFMGPLISLEAANQVISAYEDLCNEGAVVLTPLEKLIENMPYLSPALLDVTEVENRKDEEIFGPLLQLIWVKDFNEALREANRTQYGLAAGLLCDDETLYNAFFRGVRAGCINWNRPLTGASSSAPFGGVGYSGNYHPSAYYAADYCVYPVASLEEKTLKLPEKLTPGMSL